MHHSLLQLHKHLLLAPKAEGSAAGGAALSVSLPGADADGDAPPDEERFGRIIHESLAWKARVVEADPREGGVRCILNFGHTLGHGIEAAGGYGRFLHGEAISLGLVAATRLSMEKSGLPAAEGARILAALRAYNLPTLLDADIADEAVLEAMGRDKKFEAGQVRFVLLRNLGEAFVSDAVTGEDLRRALAGLRSEPEGD
jgi:3-dehydroquinate synthetase